MKNTTSNIITVLTTTAIALIACGSSSQAASITWGTPQQITNDLDVSTTGGNAALVGAFNVGDFGVSAAVVNGVNFLPFTVPAFGTGSVSVGSFSLSTAGFYLSDNFSPGSVSPPSPPFTALSGGYQSLLGSAVITGAPVVMDLTMAGLTVGQTYQFQWWANFSGTNQQFDQFGQPTSILTSTLHSATAGNSVTLDDNTSKVAGVSQEGGLGQWAIGTFTADAATQLIQFGAVPAGGPNAFAQLNAFQLRTLSSSVPETASLLAGILPLGVLLFGGLLRRRASAAL